jgi:hypothetical protein
MHRPPSLTLLRASIARRRSARADRVRLEHELASYRTPAERRDLMAMMERHKPSEVETIDYILNRRTFSPV